MFIGIIIGLLSAFCMSGSYIFSRAFIRKHKSPICIAVYSQILMGFFGIASLAISFFVAEIPLTPRFFLYVGGQVGGYVVGHTSFFMLLRYVEATRAASLIGLKIIALVLIAILMGTTVSSLQWLSVILCTIAAVGMNLSGGHLSFQSIFWLFLSVFGYAFTDVCITELMLMMPGKSMLENAFGVMGICYTVLGILALGGLFKYPYKREYLREVVPYSLCYFSSIFFLMACFGLLGVVFGSIIQAGRGIISILLGIVLLHFGLEKSEPQVSARMWIRRFIMALLMLCAMIIYSLTVQK